MPDPLTLLIIVAVLAGATKSGRNFIRSAWKATGYRTPRAAIQHHSGRLGTATGRGIASGARVSGRGARLAARNASAGIFRLGGRPLLPLMWRRAQDDPAGNTDSTRSPVADPGKDYGPGPWLLHGRSRSGRKISTLKDRDTETITVWNPEDLRRRLAIAAKDPDLEVRVTPLPKSDGPSSAGTGTAPAPGSNPARKETSQMANDVFDDINPNPDPNGFFGPAGKNFDNPPDGFRMPRRTAPGRQRTTASAPPGAGNRRVNMTARYAINLERPTTDGEFLESCIQIGSVLKGLAEDIGNWADDLGGLKLPQSVLNPLHQISDGITDAAAGANQAATNFEAEFEDARDVAAAGMTITGQDAA